jgi:23S rRNA (uracil1939-C5)-methyltransferase
MTAGGLSVKRGDEIQVAIDRLAYGGRGVGRHDGLVVFVAGAAPGDVVVARVEKVRRSHAEAVAVGLTASSAERVAPRCPHFGRCGGCTWQHIAYAAQARAKEAVVRESLAHLAGIRDAPVAPIVAAPDPWYYRNKMEFSFHPEGILGLHHRGHWDRIVPVETCFLQSPASAALVNTVRLFAQQCRLAPYDPRTHRGFLRSLLIREGRATGQRLVGLVTGEGPFPHAAALVRAVREADPAVTGVVRGVVSGASDGAPIVRTETLDGAGCLEEEVAGLRFRIGLDTFFQTNTPQAGRMVEHVVAAATPADGRLVVDLYCGVGTFALALARAGGRVIGVELSPAAVEAARANGALNGLPSATFVAGDARVMLPAIVGQHGTPDVVVLDPPRAGAGGRVMRKIGRSGARRVIYVSCNPTTLAPDVRELLAFGYRLVQVQPFDLFPQTYHVEAIAVVDRHEEVQGDRS